MVVKTGLEIYIGKLTYQTNHTHFGDRRNWNMLLSLGGEMELEINDRRLVIHPETLFLIAPGQLRRFRVIRTWSTYFLHFNMDAHINIRPDWSEACPDVYTVFLTHTDYVQLRRIFTDISRVCSIRRRGWYLLTYNLIQELILRGNMAYNAAALGNYIDAAAQMLKEFDSPLSIDEIAQKCSMSRASFFAMFRSTFGESPAKYREQQMLLRTQYLLDDTDLSIKEIAQKLNIPHPSYLSARFTKAFGMSPREYRKRHRVE